MTNRARALRTRPVEFIASIEIRRTKNRVQPWRRTTTGGSDVSQLVDLPRTQTADRRPVEACHLESLVCQSRSNRPRELVSQRDQQWRRIPIGPSSEERRVGKGGVSTRRARGAPHIK